MQPVVLFLCLFLTPVAFSQSASQPRAELNSVTVPIALDHNRVVIDVDIPLPDGSTQRIHAWVDNGNPDLFLSRRAATLMGLAISCGDKECTALPPPEITIGGMKLSLAPAKQARIPLKPVAAAAVIAPGMSVEINIPSIILRNYDVLFNLPDRKLTIAHPGTIKFNGIKTKIIVRPENGLVEVPSQIGNKKYNLALDLGSPISLLSVELFDKLNAAHHDWPHLTGATGPANIWGSSDELKRKLMLIDRLQFGPLFLSNVAVANFPGEAITLDEKRAGITGLLGVNALANYRIGIDYSRSTAYFDIGRTFNFPAFDIIGLVLRPEDDGRFTILGSVEYEGKPSVPEIQPGDHLAAVDGIPVLGSTMGQVWLMLGGEPGKQRTLTVERGGNQFKVVANLRHFLDGAGR